MYAQNRKIGNPKYFKSVREQYNQVFGNNKTKGPKQNSLTSVKLYAAYDINFKLLKEISI